MKVLCNLLLEDCLLNAAKNSPVTSQSPKKFMPLVQRSGLELELLSCERHFNVLKHIRHMIEILSVSRTEPTAAL